jgi:hypothetical protein
MSRRRTTDSGEVTGTIARWEASPQRVVPWVMTTGEVEVLRARHAARLAREIVAYSVTNRSWWFIPIMIAFAAIALAVVTTQAAVPVAVYTLF